MANDMGKKLRELRDNRGLTQREVANAVGVTEATVSRWESGHINNMRRDKIEKLAKVLQVSPLVIMGRDAESAPPPSPASSQPYRAELTERDERDIEKRLQAIRDDLDSESGIALLGDHPLTEDEKEQLLIPIKSGLETARLIAKKKFTPKKYQNGAAQRQNDTATRIGKKVLNASPAAQAAVSDIIRGDEKDK